MKLVTTTLAALLVVLALGRDATAQNLTLTVSLASFSFPSADPDTSSIVDSPTLNITYDIKGGGSNPPWHITVRANSDLLSGSDSIPVANIGWTGGGNPLAFASGAALSTSDQTLLSSSGKVSGSGTVTFHLRNLWTYKVGTYTTTIVFTISSP
jgi:hypothetical protein